MANDGTWIIGVVLIVLGSLGQNFGQNLVSLGHQGKDKIHKEVEIKNDYSINDNYDEEKIINNDLAGIDNENNDKNIVLDNKNKYNTTTVGQIIFVTGALSTFAAFGFGSQSLLASLESVQFVSNVIFCKYVHHEPITNKMTIATTLIVLGNILVVILGEKESHLYGSKDLILLYETNSAFHYYVCLMIVAFSLAQYTFITYHNSRVELKTILWKHSIVEPLSFTASSAIVGSLAVLLAKSLSMLINVSSRGEVNEFSNWFLYVDLAVWLLLVSFWLKRLDWGLQLFPPLFIIPVMQVFFVLFAIICGGIFFREFETYDAIQFIGFISGVLLILLGVYGLAPNDIDILDPNSGDNKLCHITTELDTIVGDLLKEEDKIIHVIGSELDQYIHPNHKLKKVVDTSNSFVKVAVLNIDNEDEKKQIEIKSKRIIVKRPSEPIIN